MKVIKKAKKLGLKKTAKKSRREKYPSWLVVDKEEQEKVVERQQLMTGANRPPEIWIPEGESRRLRFRDPDALGALTVYGMKVHGKFRQVTAPESGEMDLMKTRMGLIPSVKFLYEVIDIDGYEDKNGKEYKDLPRFYLVGSKLHEQLQLFRSRKGPLNGYVIEVSRSGGGLQTTYSIIDEAPTKYPKKYISLPRLATKIKDFYSPPSEEEQQALVDSAEAPF